MMDMFISALCTIYFWVLISISMVLTFIVCLLAYPFVDEKTFAGIYEFILSNFVIGGMSFIWTFHIKDLRTDKEINSDRNQYVIISNHSSFIDSIIMTKVPFIKKYMISRVFERVPVFNWLCKKSGHIMVGKDDRKNNVTSGLIRAEQSMKDGSSFVIYPEGSRSKDVKVLLPFKTGAFILAHKTKTKILPVVITGADKGMKIGGICYPTNIYLTIGHPFIVKSNSDEDIKESINKSRQFIQEQIN